MYADPGCRGEGTRSSCIAYHTRLLAWAASHERCAWRDCAVQCIFKQPLLFDAERAKTLAVLLTVLQPLLLLISVIFVWTILSIVVV